MKHPTRTLALGTSGNISMTVRGQQGCVTGRRPRQHGSIAAAVWWAISDPSGHARSQE